MKTIEFIELLQKHNPDEPISDVLQSPELYDVIKPVFENKTTGTNGRAARASKTLDRVKLRLSAQLVPLVVEWATNPAKFFEPWSLDVQPEPNQSTSRINEPVPAINNLTAKSTLADLKSALDQKVARMRRIESRKHEDNIRFLFNALFFRDLFMLFTPQNSMVFLKASMVVPYATQILSQLSAIELLDDFVHWVKLGQLYHLVGTILGEGSWFVFADPFTKESLIENLPKTLSALTDSLQPSKEKVSIIANETRAKDAAGAIRQFQRPHKLFVSSITLETCPSSSVDATESSSASGSSSSCPSTSRREDIPELRGPKRKRQAKDGQSKPSKKNRKGTSPSPSHQTSQDTHHDESIQDILPSSESGHQHMSSESSILSLNQGFASFPDFNFNQDILQFDLDLNNFNFYQDIFPFDDTSQVLGPLSA
ncbi:hypothetical protein PSPO01_16215 [Paraphaeosphaeria sporulosa]